MRKTKSKILIDILSILLIVLIGSVGVIFSILYIETFTKGVVKQYSALITSFSVGIITILTIFSIVLLKSKHKIICKILIVSIILISITLLSLYCLKVSGFLDKVDSVDDFRNFISSYGSFAVLMFILIQFLQVVVLPIPSFITVGAGVLLFGALKGAIYSCIGIILGSIVAFYIGKLFGIKVAKWLVGEENLEKGFKIIKGKDKVILTFMFLFPFFPDDILCFVAGITTISPLFFIIMIFITRIISIFCSSFSINNSIIPYNTWWGITLWILFFALTILLSIFIYKKGDKIEAIFKKRRKVSKNQTKRK